MSSRFEKFLNLANALAVDHEGKPNLLGELVRDLVIELIRNSEDEEQSETAGPVQ